MHEDPRFAAFDQGRKRMAVLMVMDVPGGTKEQYDQVNEILGIHGDDSMPEGLISHTCGASDDGVVIVDVWDSEASLERFFEEGLGAALAQAGVPQPEPRVVPVHNHLRGSAATSA
jgi:hypothetical protein